MTFFIHSLLVSTFSSSSSNNFDYQTLIPKFTEPRSISPKSMSAICFSKFAPTSKSPGFPTLYPSLPRKLVHFPRKFRSSICSKCSSSSSEVLNPDDEWLKKLPEKNKPLYSHSLPCIEAWLRSLGFYQSNEDRALWIVEKPDWHAQLSLDVTDLYIRYLKTGPGNLEKDVERRFSYALSREDIENAVLGGP